MPSAGAKYRNRRALALVLALVLSFSSGVTAEEIQPSQLPRLSLGNIVYQGAFRLPANTFGESELNYSEGPLEYNPTRHSLFIVGHSHHQAIAEFAIPSLVNSTQLEALPMVSAPLQEFSTVLGRVSGGNPQELNRIGGIKYLSGPAGPQLVVNAYEYYDAPGDNSHTTLVVRNAENIASSAVEGFFRFPAAAHASGWLSPVPQPWRDILGGDYLTGNSSGIPIISRTSVGPSAFAFTGSSLAGSDPVPDPIPTNTLLDFSLENPLHEDLSNDSGANTLWTHLSRAVYGVIIPGTRTYLTIGHSGGHESGVCYKCTQTNGNTCGGYCARDAGDYYHYYWLWDVNDLVAVRNGTMMPHAVRPYVYGVFPTPFGSKEIGGGSFDPGSGLLYLTLQRADSLQGPYANPPVIAAYRFALDNSAVGPRAPADWDGDGRTDFSVVRSDGHFAWWFTSFSSTSTSSVSPWGYFAADLFLDVDLNGDRRFDQNVARARGGAPVVEWFAKLSPDQAVKAFAWGESGDIPVSADFDGDGITDYTIFRPATGTWWSVRTQDGITVEQWGLPGDLPLAADFDGDGLDDFAVWRPALGMWAALRSSTGYSREPQNIIFQQWGLPEDHPMPGDYDGDGVDDLAVWRPSTGIWHVCRSSAAFDCANGSIAQQFGLPGDVPLRADFDGDATIDFAVWRPRDGTWYWLQSSDQSVKTKQWGLPGDLPIGAGARTLLQQ